MGPGRTIIQPPTRNAFDYRLVDVTKGSIAKRKVPAETKYGAGRPLLGTSGTPPFEAGATIFVVCRNHFSGSQVPTHRWLPNYRGRDVSRR